MEYRCCKTLCFAITSVFGTLILSGCQDKRVKRLPSNMISDSLFLYVDLKNQNDLLMRKKAFIVSYNVDSKIANWVSYNLTDNHLDGSVKRTDDFREDLSVPSPRATIDDYRHSGYSRGHLVPAADLRWDRDAMSESFLLTNICPQLPEFNSGVWENLERSIRKLAKKDGFVYIICGPVIEHFAKIIGENRVVVPQKFFKVLLKKRNGEYNGIGFIMPNQNLSGSFFDFALPIDSVEFVTGYDFFSALPDSVENKIEAKWRMSDWQ